MDRRVHDSNRALHHHCDPRTSAPDFLHHYLSNPPSPSFPMSPLEDLLDPAEDLDCFDLDRDSADDDFVHDADAISKIDVQSMTTSQYDALIESELERKWILNLSMHFRDKSKREKFFVTFRQHEHHWRRVTISLDYRNAPENSLEAELSGTQYQRDKSAKIYEAIRDSLTEIDFYSSVTNLKLETKDGRLHVHVVEDVNEIISYPPVRMIQHMNCRRVKEREIHFDSHMSGFVYKVRVHGRLLIKKEIPGPDTVDEFLYEINALNQLCHAKNVIQFYGIVVDDRDENVTGLLIDYAARGALIDVIFDSNHSLPWPTREKWARQIVGGLSEIHEAGFVQGDFTLSNIVIDDNDDAKIIDINRRGCPIGWEPPEATPLVESNQRISMYIGVKSDLYQLGMVLWALATQEDEPDAFGRPLKIEEDVQVPVWYRRVVDTCLSTNPRDRVQAIQLLSWFPASEESSQCGRPNGPAMSLNGDGNSRHDYLSPTGIPRIKAVHPPSDWAYVGWNQHPADEPFYYPSRGRSPPSPMPSNQGDYDPSRFGHRMYTWSDSYNHAPTVPSVSDVLARESKGESEPRFKGSQETLETYADGPYRFRGTETETSRDDESLAQRGRSLSRKDEYDGETELAGHDHRGSIPTSTWGPPWCFAEGKHGTGSGDGTQSRGHAGPESQADSGKDVTERASTPREHRGRFTAGRQRSVSRGRSGRSSTESASRQDGQHGTTTITTATEESTHLGSNSRTYDSESRTDRDELTHAHEHEPSTDPNPPTPDSRPLPHASFERADADLKGIGSAYGSALLGSTTIDDGRDAKRQHEIIIDEEDLGADDLDKGLREALAATDDRPSS
ncbi:hypothetical protein C8A01DRAFT_13131 [Parachaetomium inaequale]|uniref:Protein kinase domain-containing protein n=1 Tax=Parachaetomium inaequale TaxID=2588326 RepID=A0AAN6PLV1_9PEZI|nr:hypothetical protein C8A01DRAFT_13131 [Parachaetomium inaequale]